MFDQEHGSLSNETELELESLPVTSGASTDVSVPCSFLLGLMGWCPALEQPSSLPGFLDPIPYIQTASSSRKYLPPPIRRSVP